MAYFDLSVDREIDFMLAYGLTADDYGRKFKNGKGTFILVGIKPRSRKNPLVIQNEEGTKYVCAPAFLGLTPKR